MSWLLATVTGCLSLAGPLPPVSQDLDAVRTLLEEARRAAALRQVAESDVPAALHAVETWPTHLALSLERGLVEERRLRGALLEACFGPRGATARRILVHQFRSLQERAEAFTRGEYGRLDRVRDLTVLTPTGVLARWRVPYGATLPIEELLWLLQEAGVATLPFVVWPGALDAAASLSDPQPVQSAEWMLRSLLGREGLVPVRLLRATWILPAGMLDESAWRQEEPGSDDGERRVRDRLRDREARLFAEALQLLATSPSPRHVLQAVELLAAVGLPCPPAPPEREDDGARARRLVAARLRDPAVEGLDLAGGTEHWWRAESLRAQLANGRLEDASSAFLRARTRPQECRQRAADWLREPASQPATDTIAGLSAALRRDPSRAAAAVWLGRLPYGSAPGECLASARPSATEPAASEWIAAAFAIRFGGATEHPATDPGLGVLLGSGEVSPALLQGLVASPRERAILRDVLVVEADAARLLALLTAILQAAQDGAIEPAACRAACEAVRDAVASHAVDDRLLASYCARRCREFPAEEGSELAALCAELSAAFRDLDWWTAAESEWLIALDEHGWVDSPREATGK